MTRPNGRIDLLTPSPQSLPFLMQDRIPVQSYQDAMVGNWENTPLSIAYFSKENKQIIHNGIRAGVYKASGNKYTIAEQSDENLNMIMRAMFLQHSANQPTNIPQQIQALNQHVLNYCIPRIYSEVKGYLRYLHDASTLVVPLSNPVYASKDKVLELKPFF
mgnify:CR=1 FL=1